MQVDVCQNASQLEQQVISTRARYPAVFIIEANKGVSGRGDFSQISHRTLIHIKVYLL